LDTAYDIVVSGHLCLDLIPEMDHVSLKELPSPGRLIEVGGMRFSTGGAVSNTGLALERLGMRVGLMATVGDDLISGAIVSFLKARSPSLTDLIEVRSGLPSSYTIVLAPEKVDRIFLHCAGTNSSFGADDVRYDLLSGTKVFHLGYPPLLPRLARHDGEELALIFQRVKEMGIVTSLDMALPDPHGASGSVNWERVLQRTLPHVDIFVPSIEEIMFMLRRQDFDRQRHQLRSFLTRAYLDQLAQDMIGLGVPFVGFKLGDLGMYVRTSSADQLKWLRQLNLDPLAYAQQSILHPAFEVNVVGTTGAGDSAYAGLLSALIRGLDLPSAVQWACAVGACNVEAADATNGVRTWNETAARLKAGWSVRAANISG
jgi:sugar/nucleoside kinase (ribokinase family)